MTLPKLALCFLFVVGVLSGCEKKLDADIYSDALLCVDYEAGLILNGYNGEDMKPFIEDAISQGMEACSQEVDVLVEHFADLVFEKSGSPDELGRGGMGVLKENIYRDFKEELMPAHVMYLEREWYKKYPVGPQKKKQE